MWNHRPLLSALLLSLLTGCTERPLGDAGTDTDAETAADLEPTSDDGVHPCATLDDCAGLAPACELAVACDDGVCLFDDAPEGTPVGLQRGGDCKRRVCDGAGATMLVTDPADIDDDGDPCTQDICDGATPAHLPIKHACGVGGVALPPPPEPRPRY